MSEDNPAHIRMLAEHDRAVRVHDERLNAHSGEIHEMREMLARLTTIEEQNQKRLDAMEARLAAVEAKPAKRWDTVTASALTALAGGCVGYLLAGMGLG